jgi:NAD(P)-dependent dehydrogenase (short-subunit alcohol dehydrogenase family)
MTGPRNRVVLVTGGSAGIGRATVVRLAGEGTRVVTCARNGERLAEAVGDLPGVTGLVADVADAGDRAMVVERVLDEHGRLSRGIAPERVAGRIAGCLTSPRSRTVAVPRWAGLARMGDVPPVNRALDRILSTRVDGIHRLAARTVDERVRGDR